MPTYEYKCAACGHAFEAFQPISSKPLKKCPHCGKNSARRLISAGAGIIFKGSGFYETDYRSENYKSGEKKEAPPADPAKKAPAGAAQAAAPAASEPAPPPAAKAAAPEAKAAEPPKRNGKSKS